MVLMLDVLRLALSDAFIFEPLHDGPMFILRQMRALLVHILVLFLEDRSLEG